MESSEITDAGCAWLNSRDKRTSVNTLRSRQVPFEQFKIMVTHAFRDLVSESLELLKKIGDLKNNTFFKRDNSFLQTGTQEVFEQKSAEFQIEEK